MLLDINNILSKNESLEECQNRVFANAKLGEERTYYWQGMKLKGSLHEVERKDGEGTEIAVFIDMETMFVLAINSPLAKEGMDMLAWFKEQFPDQVEKINKFSKIHKRKVK